MEETGNALPEIIQPKTSEIQRGGADDGFAPVLQNALCPAILDVLSARTKPLARRTLGVYNLHTPMES